MNIMEQLVLVILCLGGKFGINFLRPLGGFIPYRNMFQSLKFEIVYKAV